MKIRTSAERSSGLLVLNKPAGMTSRRVVDRVASALPGARLGHAGTLDPLATGVLVICAGSATRLIDYVQKMFKTYRTTIRLGARSDTLDADGRITEVAVARPPARAELAPVLTRYLGLIAQTPPAFSALKVRGARAYDLARAGQAVELAPRMVQIDRVDLLRYDWPRLELEIDCGSGTYIRSIARDVGEDLGCGGLVEELTRTRIGPFTLDEAIALDGLSAATIMGRLRSPLEAVPGLPHLDLSAEQVALVAQGRALDWTGPLVEDETTARSCQPVEVALLGPGGGLVAIAEHDARRGQLRPRKVLANG